MIYSLGSYQEGPEHGDGGEEVPNVVVVKELEQDTVPVVLTRLRRGFLRQERKKKNRHKTRTVNLLRWNLRANVRSHRREV